MIVKIMFVGAFIHIIAVFVGMERTKVLENILPKEAIKIEAPVGYVLKNLSLYPDRFQPDRMFTREELQAADGSELIVRRAITPTNNYLGTFDRIYSAVTYTVYRHNAEQRTVTFGPVVEKQDAFLRLAGILIVWGLVCFGVEWLVHGKPDFHNM